MPLCRPMAAMQSILFAIVRGNNLLFISFYSYNTGLKSYSKVICVFSLVPVFGMFMLCTKMMGLAPIIGFQHHDIFPETDWSEFFLNTKVSVAHDTSLYVLCIHNNTAFDGHVAVVRNYCTRNRGLFNLFFILFLCNSTIVSDEIKIGTVCLKRYVNTRCFAISELGGSVYRDVSHVGNTRRVYDANHFAQSAEAPAAQRRFVSDHPNNSRAHICRIFSHHLCAAPRSPRIRVPTQFIRYAYTYIFIIIII